MKQYRKLNRAMRRANISKSGIKSVLLTVFALLSLTTVFSQDIVWKKNFGGSGKDSFESVTTVSDGTVVVGYSESSSFGNGDWTGVTSKGGSDAIIVKYNNDGNVVWKKNFGGKDSDCFYGVKTVSDGVVAVGYSNSSSFGTGDWTGVTSKGSYDAIIVKYDNTGNIVWKKNFGGSDMDIFKSVTSVSDGVIAVGYSYYGSFGTGDWTGVTSKAGVDAIVVKYDFNGNMLWKKSFGTYGDDYCYSVTAVSDGIVAVGWKYLNVVPFYEDAFIVKYDNNGNVVWDKTFAGTEGGTSTNADDYYSVTAVSDGVIAVGYSDANSFGNGDWAGVTSKGGSDAIMVKYNNAGNVVWKKNIGGKDSDYFYGVKTVSDGVVAVGYSYSNSFGTGDFTGITSKGATDAIIVKSDFNGNILWITNFGRSGDDRYTCITTASDGLIAAGYYDSNSFGTGDWTGVAGKGANDAIIVKYTTSGTGIANISKISNIVIYPNPASSSFFIESENFDTVKLFDMFGKEVLNQNANGKAAEINISNLPNGIYIVRVLSEDRIIGNSKIVKQ